MLDVLKDGTVYALAIILFVGIVALVIRFLQNAVFTSKIVSKTIDTIANGVLSVFQKVKR